MHVDVVVDDDHLLHVKVRTERSHDHVLGFRLAAFFKLDVEVVAARAAAREVRVEDVGETALEQSQDRRLARDGAEHQVLELGGDDGVENRVLAMRHAINGDYVVLAGRAVGARELAERAFELAHVGQHAAFDDDLGMRGHADLAAAALHHFERRAVQAAGDLEFVLVDGHHGLRGQQRERIGADDDGDRQVLAHLLGHGGKRIEVARQDQRLQAAPVLDLDALDRHVLRAGLRVPRDDDARSDVLRAVVLVVARDREQLEEVGLLDGDLPDGRVLGGDLLPGRAFLGGIAIAAEQFGIGRAHGFGDP